MYDAVQAIFAAKLESTLETLLLVNFPPRCYARPFGSLAVYGSHEGKRLLLTPAHNA